MTSIVTTTNDEQVEVLSTQPNHQFLINKLIEFFPTYTNFKGPNNWQENSIIAALNKKNILICQPTGSGKSLAFQLPAFIEEDGFTLVISPLLALMKDQVEQFGDLAEQFSSETESTDRNRILTQLLYTPKFRLLYVSPEQFETSNSDILYHIQQNVRRLKRIVIDEAQCIFTWGLSFRAAYRSIWSMFDENSCFANIPRTAVTASGLPKIRNDIMHMLRMDDSNTNNNNKETTVYMNSFNRTNIQYICIHKGEYMSSSYNNNKDINRNTNLRSGKYNYIRKCLHDYGLLSSGQSGIIYCRTRKESEYLAKELNCAVYHAGLSKEIRNFNQTRWMLGESKIICATIAFGLGIHKSNVRFIIHTSPPATLESYYQESGRGGRDGCKSMSFLFHEEADFTRHRHFVQIQKEDKESTLSQWTSLPGFKEFNQQIMNNVGTYFSDLKEAIDNMQCYCRLNNKNCCRRAFLLNQFDEVYDGTCQSNGDQPCDICEIQMDIVTEEGPDETKEDIEDISTNWNFIHKNPSTNTSSTNNSSIPSILLSSIISRSSSNNNNAIVDDGMMHNNNNNNTMMTNTNINSNNSNNNNVESLKDCITKENRLDLIKSRMASTTSKNATTRKVEQGRNNNAAALTRTIIRNKSLSKCETKEDRLSVIKQRMGK